MNLVILFSGQGLQSQHHLDEVKKLAQQQGYTDLLTTALPEIYHSNFTTDQLFQNNLAQPMIFALQYLRWQQIKTTLADPLLFSGYSLGEASAFCCSATLDFQHALTFIQKRAALMSLAASDQSGLVAIQGLNTIQLTPLLEASQTEISIKLNECHFIVGGQQLQLKQLMKQAEQIGAQQLKPLNVSIASHTTFMHQPAFDFACYTTDLPNHNMQVPIVSTSAGQKYDRANQAYPILAQQIDHPLDWSICMQTISEYQPDVILEIGPGNALTKMISEIIPNAACRAYDDFKQIDGLLSWLSRHN